MERTPGKILENLGNLAGLVLTKFVLYTPVLAIVFYISWLVVKNWLLAQHTTPNLGFLDFVALALIWSILFDHASEMVQDVKNLFIRSAYETFYKILQLGLHVTVIVHLWPHTTWPSLLG